MKTHPTEQDANIGKLAMSPADPRYYLLTLCICFAIATLLWSVKDDQDFVSALVFSLCIGACTHFATSLVMLRWNGRLPIYAAMIFTVPIGGASGTLLAGLLLGLNLDDFYSQMVSTLIVSVVASSIFVSLFHLIQIKSALRQETIRRLKQEKQMVETELRLLQSQIEPHFLFNTLSNVVSLMSTDTPKAETMLRRLIQLLRVSLRRTRSRSSTLQDELELVDDYLSILKIRMEDRLEFNIEVEVNTAEIEFPPLILQPIVENAVSHGLEPKEEGGSVHIRVSNDPSLVIVVTDTGLGLASNSSGAGIGLSNVKQRLHMLYGDAARLEIRENKPDGLIVTIMMPMPTDTPKVSALTLKTGSGHKL